jgi:hypothetical protein
LSSRPTRISAFDWMEMTGARLAGVELVTGGVVDVGGATLLGVPLPPPLLHAASSTLAITSQVACLTGCIVLSAFAGK